AVIRRTLALRRGLERDGARSEATHAADYGRRLGSGDLPGTDLAGPDTGAQVGEEPGRRDALAEVEHHLHRPSSVRPRRRAGHFAARVEPVALTPSTRPLGGRRSRGCSPA